MKVEVVLSLFHDGQFFVALFERREGNEYCVAKKTFAVKPSNQEILQLIVDEYRAISFSDPSAIDGDNFAPERIRNPKRRQREAAKAAKKVFPSTKAQQALKDQQSKNKALSKKSKIEDKKLYADRQYRLRVEKKKQKHKGR